MVKVVPGEKPDTLVSQRVAVKTGVRQPGKVEITEGLEEGDTVVTAGHQRLQKDGVPVRVIDLAAAGKAAAGPAGAASAPLAGASAAAAKGAPAAPALSGPNPCTRG